MFLGKVENLLSKQGVYAGKKTGSRYFRESLEDYLTTIYRLQLVHGIARTTYVAKALGVKPGTVTKVVQRLEKAGLVKVTKFKGIELTDKGLEIARKIIRKHRILEVFLSEYLGFDPLKSHELAHKMEHLPEEVIEAIYERMGKPKVCPHGNPIEPEDPRKIQVIGVKLSSAKKNHRYRVLRSLIWCIKRDEKSILGRKLRYGVVVEVMDVGQDYIKAIVDNEEISISKEDAELVIVEEID